MYTGRGADWRSNLICEGVDVGVLETVLQNFVLLRCTWNAFKIMHIEENSAVSKWKMHPSENKSSILSENVGLLPSSSISREWQGFRTTSALVCDKYVHMDEHHTIAFLSSFIQLSLIYEI